MVAGKDCAFCIHYLHYSSHTSRSNRPLKCLSLSKRFFVTNVGQRRTHVFSVKLGKVTQSLRCVTEQAPGDEIDATIREAQGYNLSGADSDLLKYSLMGNIAGIQQALAAGAKPDVKDKEGRTALHLAAAIGVPSICELLLRAVGSRATKFLNCADNLGLTPLHMAAGYCRTATVEYLLSWKPDLNIKSKDGDKPIDLVLKLLQKEPKKMFFLFDNSRYLTLTQIYNMLVANNTCGPSLIDEGAKDGFV
eukprot:jgi/Galph1/4404/GphlegSOOS_G3124.1